MRTETKASNDKHSAARPRLFFTPEKIERLRRQIENEGRSLSNIVRSLKRHGDHLNASIPSQLVPKSYCSLILVRDEEMPLANPDPHQIVETARDQGTADSLPPKSFSHR